MFGLFSKKKKILIVHDKIWTTEDAKFSACIDFKKDNPEIIFVAWFEETKNNLQAYFKERNIEEEILLADRLSLNHHDNDFIFVEHHPLQAEEHRIADKFAKKEITVLSSLTEPIFKLFGADRIINLMKQMGMNEDEMLEHDMISNSIMKAQEKIAAKSTFNASAKSQGEWLQNAGFNK